MTLPFPADTRVPGAATTHAVRRNALADLATAGWPSRKREPWRYTDLEGLVHPGIDLAPPPADFEHFSAARAALDRFDCGHATRQLVLFDGQRLPGLGAPALEDLAIRDVEADWPVFAAEFANRIAATRHPLAALNTAFTERGLWIRVPAHTAIVEPVHLVFLSSGRTGIAAHPRVVIDAEEGAAITLVQHFVDYDNTATGWINCVTQVRQARDSRVTLYRLQQHAPTRTHTSLLAADLAHNAELAVGYFDLGGKLVRNDVQITLMERRSRVDLNGLFIAGSDQHLDNHTVIDHAAAETGSSEDFRGIVGTKGRGVFNGKVIVRPGSQRIEATQRNDNLLLGEHAEIDTKPELEIYADDVKCSHGSTVGELDAEQLFYLRSRGFDTVTAHELLTTAFAAVATDKIANLAIRSSALALATARLRQLLTS